MPETLELPEQYLLERGFRKDEWNDGDEDFVDYRKQVKEFVSIEVSGINLVEVVIEGCYTSVEIESLEELDLLIKMFS